MKDDYAYLASRNTHCECCGSGELLEIHHTLFHRLKGHPELNVRENCAVVCHKCHVGGLASNKDFQDRHWQKRCKELGKEHMEKWLEGLPLKVKEHW